MGEPSLHCSCSAVQRRCKRLRNSQFHDAFRVADAIPGPPTLPACDLPDVRIHTSPFDGAPRDRPTLSSVDFPQISSLGPPRMSTWSQSPGSVASAIRITL